MLYGTYYNYIVDSFFLFDHLFFLFNDWKLINNIKNVKSLPNNNNLTNTELLKLPFLSGRVFLTWVLVFFSLFLSNWRTAAMLGLSAHSDPAGIFLLPTPFKFKQKNKGV